MLWHSSCWLVTVPGRQKCPLISGLCVSRTWRISTQHMHTDKLTDYEEWQLTRSWCVDHFNQRTVLTSFMALSCRTLTFSTKKGIIPMPETCHIKAQNYTAMRIRTYVRTYIHTVPALRFYILACINLECTHTNSLYFHYIIQSLLYRPHTLGAH